MIELPEAVVLAEQINCTLKGKTIKSAIRGYSPHKFAFTGDHSHEEFADLMKGKEIGKSWSDGNIILTEVNPGYILSLGCGGEKIVYHTQKTTLPKKHQILLEFDDGTFLSVTVSGWGETRLLKSSNLENHPHIQFNKLDLLSAETTIQTFTKLIYQLPENKKYSAKKFYVSDPGLNGIGNGVIQDIFFLSGIHPKREMRSLTESEIALLYATTQLELKKMITLGGRDCETNLFGEKGRYIRIMHPKAVGSPCPQCENAIMKNNYLGGTIYYCKTCQPVN